MTPSYSWTDPDGDKGRVEPPDDPCVGAVAMLTVVDSESGRDVAVYVSAKQAERIMHSLHRLYGEGSTMTLRGKTASGGPKGWECPKCGTVNAPWMPTCGNCKPKAASWPHGSGRASRGD